MTFPDEAASPEEAAHTIDVVPCTRCGRGNPVDAHFCAGCGLQLGSRPVAVDPVDAVADPLVGRVVADRYRIMSLLGRGGMGVVYKVEHVHIGKLMAMKLLHGGLVRAKDTVKRFQREAQAASRLSHPNTVQVFDFGRSEGLMYLVMEYVDGRDLGQMIRQDGTLTFERVARICAQICASVSEAHGHGIVHRDLKPENVMVSKPASHAEMAKVLDFGLAKLREGRGYATVTRAGAIVGTPYYMSPEQIRGDEVDGRADIYAIGAMMYKACTGVPPFAAPTPVGVLTKHLTEALVPPSQRAKRPLPPDVDRIVGRAMEKDRANRYESADALREDLLGYMASIDASYPELAQPSRSSSMASERDSRLEQVATRGDIDRYEKRIHRRGTAAYVMLSLVIAGAAFAGWYALTQHRTDKRPLTREQEPNHQLERANPIPPGVAVRGQLGRRLNRKFSDVDLYSFHVDSATTLRVSLSAIPNMDVVLDIVKPGQSTPLLEANSGGFGGAEVVPNFHVKAGDYVFRVRERWVEGEFPTENVSDDYTIRWDSVRAEKADEIEVNDSLELSNDLTSASPMFGYIGWRGDVDAFCVRETSGRYRAEVTGVHGLDLAIRLVERRNASSVTIDKNGVGEGERTGAFEPSAELHGTCIEVSVRASRNRRSGAHSSNGEERYRIALRPL